MKRSGYLTPAMCTNVFSIKRKMVDGVPLTGYVRQNWLSQKTD